MAQLLVDSDAPARHDVSSIDRITLSSAHAAPDLWARIAAAFPSATLWNAYALTEGGGARTLARYDPYHPESVGRPVGDSEVRVVTEAGCDAAAMEPGEIWLRRRGTPPRGYYRDADATALAFSGDWLRSGDLGYLDGDGRLYLVDRIKDLIISGGLNIASVEIEGVLEAHPCVREAAVFGLPHPVLGQEVAAAVVLHGAADARELQSSVRARLGETHVPRRIEVVESLPRTDSGKVRKQELRERFAATEPARDAAPPGSPAEHAVAAIWLEVLGLDGVGIHDDFFALGGHSLAATQVVARLDDAFDVELPVTLVFEHPTIAETAAALTEALGHRLPA
jgi:acyl-CoA synthetase (AMP-forming)/AMP-acid ligase II/acyl carrier protein